MTSHHADFTVRGPASLIAGLPAALGFVPERSLILVLVERAQMGAVIRVDLSAQLADEIGHLAEVAAASEPEAAIAVIVDADGASCSGCDGDYRGLGDVLDFELECRGIALWDVHVVDRIGPGGRWHCVYGCGGGLIDDPATSPMAMAAVLDGRRLYRRRAELQEVIAVADEQRSQALAAAVQTAAAARRTARRDDPLGCARRDAEAVIAAADRVAAGSEPADADLADLAAALADDTVRDVVCALAVGEKAHDAETLWVLLARTLPTPWRAQALVLLAFFAYVRGDGPLAGVSLEAALRCRPAHRMAGMLDRALQSGMRPDQIRELAVTGYEVAERVGVPLPPRQSNRPGAW